MKITVVFSQNETNTRFSSILTAHIFFRHEPELVLDMVLNPNYLRYMFRLTLAAALFTLPALPAGAQVVIADADFGNNGQIRYDWGFDLTHKVKVQPDQHILVAATGGTANNTDFSIIRLKPDGDIDQDFGLAGRFEADLGAFEKATDLLILPDGRILSCGLSSTNNGSIIISRLLSDGALDSTFGQNGFLQFSRPGLNITSSLVEMAADNALGAYIAFQAFDAGSQQLCILHCTENGDIEPWGTQQMLQIPISGETDGFERCIASDANGKIWLAYVELLNNQSTWRVVQLNPDGSPVSGFNYIAFAPSAFSGAIREIVIRPGGGITLCGYAEQGSGTESPIMVQINADGSLNNSFGSGGVFTGSPGFGLKAVSAAQLSDDSFLLTGISGNNGFALRKVSANGQPDWNFGNNGLFYLNAANAEATTLFLLPGDSTLFLGGSEFLSLNPDIHIQKINFPQNTTSIDALFFDKPIFYPNPSDGIIFLNELNAPKFRSIQVYNAQSMLVYEINWANKNGPIHIPELPNGIYFMHFITGESRIVKQYIHLNTN